MKKNILYVIDTVGWIQEKRGNLFNQYQHKFKIKIISKKRFKVFWRLGFYRNEKIFFASWRIVHSLLKENKNFFNDNDFNNLFSFVTSHSNIGGGLRPEITTGKKNLKDAFKEAIHLLKRFKGVSVNSNILKDFLSKHIKNLYYCPNGVDINFFVPTKRRLTSKITIGWLGKVRAAKNFSLLEKIKESFKHNPNFDFRYEIFKKNKKKKMNSYELLKFYHSLDFYLCCSWNEGTPNPVLEAAACGLPIISTKVGNIPDLIENKINGFLIKPEKMSAVKCINSLLKLNENEYEKISKNIRKQVEKNWDWRIKIKNYINFFEEAFNG